MHLPNQEKLYPIDGDLANKSRKIIVMQLKIFGYELKVFMGFWTNIEGEVENL